MSLTTMAMCWNQRVAARIEQERSSSRRQEVQQRNLFIAQPHPRDAQAQPEQAVQVFVGRAGHFRFVDQFEVENFAVESFGAFEVAVSDANGAHRNDRVGRTGAGH